MGLIEDELLEVKKLCENVVIGSKVVSCVPSMVRVQIKKTDFKNVTICIQFPENYPRAPLLIELKSKTLSEKLLGGLANVCEEEAKKTLGKPQILAVLKFLSKFIHENALCCCYDEVNFLKKILTGGDELKLKQKSSSIILKVSNRRYFFNCKIVVPEDYPKQAILIEDVLTNFSPTFNRHMVCQCQEIARRCVEPPIRKKGPFQPEPSLRKSVEFLVDCVKRIPSENCQLCNEICFPEDPRQLEIDENSPKHIERVHCGHLFHQECFLTFMKTPPFGNKKCKICGMRIFHYKWSLSDKLAEERWAHEQARGRELQEVTDFFK